jgi:hypothetical protein
MNRLLVFGLGVLVGAGMATYGPALMKNGRPLIKEAMKAAMKLGRNAQVQGAGLLETLEDLYAEAMAEAAAAPAAAVGRKRRRAKAAARARKRPARKAHAAQKAPELAAGHA